MKTPRYGVPLSFATLAVSVLGGAVLMSHPVSAAFTTSTGAEITGWLSKTAYTFYWPILLCLCAFGVADHLFVGRQARAAEGFAAAALRVLRPLPLWPPLVWAGYGTEWFGTALASLFLAYGTVFVAALVLCSLYDEAKRLAPRLAVSRPLMRAFSPLLAAAYFILMGLGVSALRPEFDGGGDVVHYQTMTESLINDGNLELTDEFGAIVRKHHLKPEALHARDGYLAKCHLKRNAEGKIYSYHSFGFPLLAAGFHSLFGGASRWILLSLLSLLGIAGCFAGARAAGASRTDTLFTVGLTALSADWILTSASFLPEMTGMALTAWGFWAVMAQGRGDRRAASAVAAALSCSFLPYAHVRFAPIALALAFFFGLEGLLARGEPFWRGKFPRLALFSLVCLASWAYLFHCHQTMFGPPPPLREAVQTTTPALAASKVSGGAYNYGRVFFAYPLAMWGMFADQRGLVSLVPAIWFLIAAPAAVALRGKREARWALYGFLTSVAILLACCTTRVALSGACLNGRYFFQAVPLLLPFATLLLPRLSRAGRLWFFFLLLLPIAALACSVFHFSTVDLVRTPAQVWKTPLCANLYQPLVSCLETEDALSRACGFAFAGCMILASALFVLGGRARLASPLALGVLAAGLLCGFVSHSRENAFSEYSLWRFAAYGDFVRFHADHLPADGYVRNMTAPDPEQGAWSLLFTDRKTGGKKPSVHLFNLAKPRRQRLLTFADRRWYSLRVPDFKLEAGVSAAVLLRGKVVRGTARLLAYRTAFGGSGPLEAERVHGEGPFAEKFIFPPRRERAKYNVFLSMDGDVGEAVVDDVELVPYVPGLESVLGPLR